MKGLLLTHLGFVLDHLKKADTVREFFQVREHLLAYSGIVGDEAYMGFYGRELRSKKASPGAYRITVAASGVEKSTILHVRADPMADR